MVRASFYVRNRRLRVTRHKPRSVDMEITERELAEIFRRHSSDDRNSCAIHY